MALVALLVQRAVRLVGDGDRRERQPRIKGERGEVDDSSSTSPTEGPAPAD